MYVCNNKLKLKTNNIECNDVFNFNENKNKFLKIVKNNLLQFNTNRKINLRIYSHIENKIVSIEELKNLFLIKPELNNLLYRLSISIDRINNNLYLDIWPIIFSA